MLSLRSALQLLLVTCLVALLTQCAHGKPQLTKDNRYSVIDIRNAPYTVQLRDDSGKFLCAGALISSEFVMTAAECFNDIDYSKTVIVAGAKTLAEVGEKRHIAKATIHPAYDSKTKSANVAVLKLKEPLKTGEPAKDNIVSIPVCEEPIKEKEAVQIVGWRHMSKAHADADHLYSTRIFVTSQEKCHKDFNATPEYGIFCAAGNDYDDHYDVSDLGGPAIYGGKVCGIATCCTNCSEIDYINSFVDLHHFGDFIKEAMA